MTCCLQIYCCLMIYTASSPGRSSPQPPNLDTVASGHLVHAWAGILWRLPPKKFSFSVVSTSELSFSFPTGYSRNLTSSKLCEFCAFLELSFPQSQLCPVWYPPNHPDTPGLYRPQYDSQSSYCEHSVETWILE